MALKIAFYQSVWPQTLLSRKKKKRLNTKNEDTSKTHGMPFDTCFGKSSESEPFWILFFPSEVGGMPSLATVSNFVFYNLLPQDSLGFFFLPQNPECFIENMHTFFSPTQQYKTVQSLL